ncbi:hypothetical protein A8924_4221 [Saccharopolyspora erythraea NRRL 2338]|uniref:non-specific serine/threonine protein kinase n=2 Tax=Saccharopolyspora erythraea TaxID=1836 RepID=A4FGD0_SACEN|nr:protein kinase [Saccharopolyspora erythraea]EQD84881.1 hypothetical protein N599_17765 [Saccharopolyspora erythraea D]PFG96809.1 hypothetical protein A8924_4221 [Saccharopolyspora erythraea NRRL 2338]QRK87050.1 protein kinase [Saccharopolyspora erythraea]CAM03105.1 putative serine/threonine protein kinase [Saccharopolyspora erythraea NRRL 2338]
MFVPNDLTSTGGTRVIAGRYRMDSRIGTGAMGAVWAGTDVLLHRPVAVKEVRLSPRVPEEEAAEFRERALREARSLAVVTHPNVVMLYDVADDAGGPFVVMELVPAESLSSVLKRTRLSHEQLAVFVDGVAAALQAAHRVGIVHRDVKPGNVLLGKHGQVKLGDFGISRNAAESTLTRTGIVLGTPAYVAPEIAQGEAPSPAADLWSLGATLYSAAHGRLPYESDSDPLITLSAIIHGPVPQHQMSGPLGEVLSGLMVKDPARRMPLHEVRRRLMGLVRDAGEAPFDAVLDPAAPALRTLTTRPGSAEEPPGSSEPASQSATTTAVPQEHSRRMRPWVAAALGALAVVLVVAAAGAGFLYGRSGTPGLPPGDGQAGQPPVADEPDSVPESGDPPDPYDGLEAEASSARSRVLPVAVADAPSAGRYVGSVANGDWLRFDDVDFGTSPTREVSARLAKWTSEGEKAKIEIRVDDYNAPPIAKINVTPSGGAWKSVPVEIQPLSGVHDVYLVFSSEQDGGFLNLDWVRFVG